METWETSCQTGPEARFAFDLAEAVKVQSQSSKFTDVVVEVEGEDFHTHRFFLNAFSGFFQGLFNSGMKECIQDKVVLKDVSRDVFRVILKFIFQGEIFLDSANIFDIWKTADMLQIMLLVKHCKSFVVENICRENCVSFFQYAKAIGDEAVKSQAWMFIIEDFDNMLETHMAKLLALDYLDVEALVKCNRLMCRSEDSIVAFVLEWVSHNPTETETLNATTTSSESPRSESPVDTSIVSKYPRALHLKELLLHCHLLLLNEAYVMNVLPLNYFVRNIMEVKSIVSKLIQLKLEDSHSSSFDGSSVSCYRRVGDGLENVILSITSSREINMYFSKHTPDFEDIWQRKIYLMGVDIDKIVAEILASASWGRKLFMVTSGKLYCLKIDSVLTGCACLETMDINELSGHNVGMVVIANQIYILGKDVKKRFSIYCSLMCSKYDCHMLPLRDKMIPMHDIILAKYKKTIIIIGQLDGVDPGSKTAIQCIDTTTFTSHPSSYMSEGIEENYITAGLYKPQTFETPESTFILYPNGKLYQIVEDGNTGRLKPQFVMKCWNSLIVELTGASIMNRSLVLFTHDLTKVKKYLQHSAVYVRDGVFTKMLFSTADHGSFFMNSSVSRVDTNEGLAHEGLLVSKDEKIWREYEVMDGREDDSCYYDSTECVIAS